MELLQNGQIFVKQHFNNKCFETKLPVTAATMRTCWRKLMNNPNTLSVCERKSHTISHNLLHSCSWGHMACLQQKDLDDQLSATQYHIVPPCSPLVFPQTLLAAYQRRTEPIPSPLPTVNCEPASMMVPKRQSLLWYFFRLFNVQTKLEAFFCKNPLMFRTNEHNKQQLRKSALSLRLESTLLPLFAGHICIWVTKGSHTAFCCVNISEKGECQPELILHSGCHCLCSALITNSTHDADTSHLLHQRLMWQSGQQTGRSPSKQGNILLSGFLAVVWG